MGRKGKYNKYKKMMGSASLRKHLPRTKTFRRDNFLAMMSNYKSVIVKPTYGSGGVGVIKVSRKGGNRFIVHQGAKKSEVRGKSNLYGYVKSLTGGKSNIVQRYISLIKINGRPVDYRVMVQRKPGESWTITGKLAKVAGANHIITNVARSKGYVVTAKTAVNRHFSSRKAKGILRKMNDLGLKTAKQIYGNHSHRITGLDMGVDKKGKVWIIESNSAPALSLFLKLKNKASYRKIINHL